MLMRVLLRCVDFIAPSVVSAVLSAISHLRLAKHSPPTLRLLLKRPVGFFTSPTPPLLGPTDTFSCAKPWDLSTASAIPRRLQSAFRGALARCGVTGPDGRQGDIEISGFRRCSPHLMEVSHSAVACPIARCLEPCAPWSILLRRACLAAWQGAARRSLGSSVDLKGLKRRGCVELLGHEEARAPA